MADENKVYRCSITQTDYVTTHPTIVGVFVTVYELAKAPTAYGVRLTTAQAKELGEELIQHAKDVEEANKEL